MTQPIQSNTQPFRRIGGALVLLMALSEVCGLLFCFLFPIFLTQGDPISTAAIVALYGIAFPLAIFYLMGCPPLASAPVQQVSVPTLIRTTVTCFGTVYLANFITLFLLSIVETLTATTLYNPVDILIENVTFLVFFQVCVLAPVAEELFFRWAVLSKLAPYGRWFATLTSALLFALLHGNLYQFLYAFATGVLLADFRFRGGSLWQVIIIHALLNGSSLFWLTDYGATLGLILVPLLFFGGIYYLIKWLPSFFSHRPPKSQKVRGFWRTREIVLFLLLLLCSAILSNLLL